MTYFYYLMILNFICIIIYRSWVVLVLLITGTLREQDCVLGTNVNKMDLQRICTEKTGNNL